VFLGWAITNIEAVVENIQGIKWRRFRRDLPTYETRGSISSNLSIIEITLKTLEDIDRGVFR